MYLGVDIGSTTSKAVIIDEANNILARSVIDSGTGSQGPELAVKEALAQAGADISDVKKTVATGYGRKIFAGADKNVTEISCHARGAFFTDDRLRTIIDIGGQDSKVIRINANGQIDNFVMNEKCAAGTGRFLEVMSRVFGCDISELSELAERGQEGVTISSVCTVFAESEIISQLASGKVQTDVALGAIESIASRIAGLAKRVGIRDLVGMTGGGANNPMLVEKVAEELNTEVIKVEYAQTIGALGAALFAKDLAEEK